MSPLVLLCRATAGHEVFTGRLQGMTTIAHEVRDWICGDNFVASHVRPLSLSMRSANRERRCSKNQNTAPKTFANIVSAEYSAQVISLRPVSSPAPGAFLSGGEFISSP